MDGWKMSFRCFYLLVSGSAGGFQTCVKISPLKEISPIRLDDNCYSRKYRQIVLGSVQFHCDFLRSEPTTQCYEVAMKIHPPTVGKVYLCSFARGERRDQGLCCHDTMKYVPQEWRVWKWDAKSSTLDMFNMVWISLHKSGEALQDIGELSIKFFGQYE